MFDKWNDTLEKFLNGFEDEGENKKKKKKKNYKEVFCRNRYLSKCLSTTKIYESGKTEETSHSKRCIMKIKKEKKTIIKETIEIEENKFYTENEVEVGVVEDDFIVDFKSNKDRERYLKAKNDSKIIESEDNFLKSKHKEIIDICKRKPFKVSEFINYQNYLNGKGLKLAAEEEIRKCANEEELEKYIDIYKVTFKNFNKVMKSWINKETTRCLFRWNKLLGGMTFKKINYNGLFFIQLLLLVVEADERKKGIGSLLVDFLIKSYEKVVVYSDKNAVDFYIKLGFNINPLLLNKIKDQLNCEINVIFLCYGFDELDF